jgi:hypothetical protein
MPTDSTLMTERLACSEQIPDLPSATGFRLREKAEATTTGT